ncbi:MAG TPA: DNA translocase FtsK [Candidatus Coprenecus pullistercoris]|nr:DNA translocase FtsK [Candidatus Coprenecus pullistercoris]
MEKTAVVRKKKAGKKTAFGKLREVLDNETVRFVLGVAFALAAVFTLAAIVSYVFTWRSDQSLLTDPGYAHNDVTAENAGGKLGFGYARLLVSKWFGAGAFIVPFFLGGMSLYFFNKKRKIKLFRLFCLSLMGCVVLSALFSYVFSFTPARNFLGDGPGGSYGYYINEWLVSMTGALGAGCIVLFFLLLWIILLNNKVVGKITGLFDRLFARIDRKSEAGTAEESVDDADELEKNAVAGACEEPTAEDIPLGEEEEAVVEEGEDTPEFEIISPAVPEDSETVGNADNAVAELRAEEAVPPVEVIGDPSDYSAQLTDEQWKTRYDPRLSLSNYRMPDLSLLQDYSGQIHEVSRDELERNNRLIVSTLKDFRISISKISARVGPTVTLYEVVPAPGVRVAQIVRLEDDIARSLAARGVRVVMLTGTNAIGIEVANDKPSIVSMRSILSDPKFAAAKYDLPVVIGRTISNEAYSFDLAKMPHLLVAGATGQGKSVGLNAIITSLLYRKHPAELKFVLVDPKKVELSLYAPLEKHYLAKMPDSEDAIITDTKQVVYTLRSLCKLMDRRYDLLKAASVRNVKEYNEKFLSRKLNPYKGHEYMPYIVVIIDEFADLLMTAGREVEEPIARLAQLARAIGIHLVIATQRPTTNIITGTIKANFPARIAFRVISSVDSKTILDQTGANQLIGRGDMLISTGNSEPVRLQCAFIDTPEVDNVAKFISAQAGFGGPYLLPECDADDASGSMVSSKASGAARDDLFNEAARLIVREQVGSTSLIQRKMNLGYNRAGRIMDQLEDAGIVGPSEGSKPRQVRITSLESLEDILSTL